MTINEIHITNLLLCLTLMPWAVVVAQLVERSLPRPSSADRIQSLATFFTQRLQSTVLKRQKLRKRGLEWPNKKLWCHKYIIMGAVVVAQLEERSLPISDVRGLNPVIGKNLLNIYCQLCIEKTKIKEKEAGNCPFFKKTSTITNLHQSLWY